MPMEYMWTLLTLLVLREVLHEARRLLKVFRHKKK